MIIRLFKYFIFILWSFSWIIVFVLILKKFKIFLNVEILSSIIIRMIEWTIRFFEKTFIALFAWSSSIYLNMIVKFFPAMSEFARQHIRTSPFYVKIEVLELLPIFAITGLIHNFSIPNQFPPEVLLIVSVNTVLSVMLCNHWAHNSFVIKNIKLGIFFFFMKSFYSEFCFIVNKGTEWSVFTLVWILKIRTITSLKPVFVIHLFYYVMRVSTILRTILEIAFFWWIFHWSTFILFWMVKNALF